MSNNTQWQNRPCQPTDTSVLSVCDDHTVAASMNAASACAAHPYAYWTDAALAVSVFAFISLLRGILDAPVIDLVAPIAAVVIYQLRDAIRLRYGALLFIDRYEKPHIPCSYTPYAYDR